MNKSALFSEEKINDIVVVTVNLSRGTMDSAPQLREYIMYVIGEGEKYIIADLSYCDFMDSSFLGALVAILKKLKSIQGDFKIVLSKKTPEGILALTKMDKVFDVHKTVEDAIKSFN